MVQADIQGFFDYNHQDLEGIFTRPALDQYMINAYWNFITKGLSKEEVADLQLAKDDLEHYERIYKIMDYSNQLTLCLTTW